MSHPTPSSSRPFHIHRSILGQKQSSGFASTSSKSGNGKEKCKCDKPDNEDASTTITVTTTTAISTSISSTNTISSKNTITAISTSMTNTIANTFTTSAAQGRRSTNENGYLDLCYNHHLTSKSWHCSFLAAAALKDSTTNYEIMEWIHNSV